MPFSQRGAESNARQPQAPEGRATAEQENMPLANHLSNSHGQWEAVTHNSLPTGRWLAGHNQTAAVWKGRSVGIVTPPASTVTTKIILAAWPGKPK